MCNYNLDALRAALKEIKKKESFDRGAARFVEELQTVPENYYNNIFFVGNADGRSVVVTDIHMDAEAGDIRYSFRDLENQEIEEVPFGRYRTLSAEVARNIITAVEVAETAHKQQKNEEEMTRRNREIIEEANLRRL